MVMGTGQNGIWILAERVRRQTPMSIRAAARKTRACGRLGQTVLAMVAVRTVTALLLGKKPGRGLTDRRTAVTAPVPATGPGRGVGSLRPAGVPQACLALASASWAARTAGRAATR